MEIIYKNIEDIEFLKLEDIKELNKVVKNFYENAPIEANMPTYFNKNEKTLRAYGIYRHTTNMKININEWIQNQLITLKRDNYYD